MARRTPLVVTGIAFLSYRLDEKDRKGSRHLRGASKTQGWSGSSITGTLRFGLGAAWPKGKNKRQQTEQPLPFHRDISIFP